MKSLLWKSAAQTLAFSSIFSIGCFDWCPFCTKDDQKFSPKPAYSLNKLDANPAPVTKNQIPGAGAVSIPENPLDGQPIEVTKTPKAAGAPSPIATSNPVSEITPVKHTPEKPNPKVHSIPAPESPNIPVGAIPNSTGTPDLGIPATSLTPGLSPIQELTKTSDLPNPPAKEIAPAKTESVIIPPPPGLPGLKQTPPTTIIQPSGSMNTTPIGIPTPPGATPYR